MGWEDSGSDSDSGKQSYSWDRSYRGKIDALAEGEKIRNEIDGTTPFKLDGGGGRMEESNSDALHRKINQGLSLGLLGTISGTGLLALFATGYYHTLSELKKYPVLFEEDMINTVPEITAVFALQSIIPLAYIAAGVLGFRCYYKDKKLYKRLYSRD